MSLNELKRKDKIDVNALVQKLQEEGVKAQICKRPRLIMKL